MIRSPLHFYHLTSRSHDIDRFYLPTSEIWEILLRNLRILQIEHELEILFFIVLTQRFHLVLRSPTKEIDRVMFMLKMNATRTIQKRSGRINRIFDGRYHGSLIQNESDLHNIHKYLAWLPVKNGLSKNFEDYPLSTEYNNFPEHLSFPLVPWRKDRKWLGNQLNSIESKSIEGGLKKTIFSYQKNTSNRPIIPK